MELYEAIVAVLAAMPRGSTFRSAPLREVADEYARFEGMH